MQHSTKSPQQSLAANARAEVDINAVPTASLKKIVFISVFKKNKVDSAKEDRRDQSGGVHILETGPVQGSSFLCCKKDSMCGEPKTCFWPRSAVGPLQA